MKTVRHKNANSPKKKVPGATEGSPCSNTVIKEMFSYVQLCVYPEAVGTMI